MARPFLGRAVDPAVAQDSLGGRVEDQEPRARVGDDDAVAHADRGPTAGSGSARGGPPRTRASSWACCSEALVQPADLLELPQPRECPRGVVGQGLERRRSRRVGIDRQRARPPEACPGPRR